MKKKYFLFAIIAGFLLIAMTTAVFAAQRAGSEPSASDAAGFKDLDSFLKSLPEAEVKPLDDASALLLSALPLACVDDLQPKPSARGYFWQPNYRTVDAYDKTRAFYGCNDWQTAVSATWTLVTLLKRFPELSSGNLIREKLTDHLGRRNLDGELDYFRTAGNFQRPYGYAWFLKLDAELATWKDPDGTRYSENVTPLARYFVDSLVGYLVDLERPNRTAGQANTAFTLGLLLDYVDITRDMTIRRAVSDATRRLYATDKDCATDHEAVVPEMNSPCLAEAALMSRVLDPSDFVKWFDTFLPAVYSAKFKPLWSVSFDAVPLRRGGGRGQRAASTKGGEPDTNPGAAPASAAEEPPAGGRGGPAVSPRATWIGLAFTRAAAYDHLASALPSGDPRVTAFRRLAAIHAQLGQKELSNPAAFDAPWIGALAVSVVTAIGGSR